MEKATLAGGCFWCIESAFLDTNGVTKVTSGYTGGGKADPSYEEVCTGKTGHFEAVEILFDPKKITFLQLLDIFWRNIDPLDEGGQFADRGSQYQTAIFYHNEKQKQLAEKSKEKVQSLFEQPVVTKIIKAEYFYTAEGYHQGYCKREPLRYKLYRQSHEERLQKLWKGKTIPSDLKEYLTPLQYKVAYEEGTEPPFSNDYYDHHEEGIYVDIVSGEPLFSSEHKFDSGSGWPSFTQAINPEELVAKKDNKLGQERIEIRSKSSDIHLGHVFPDGPEPTHLRFCINSAALRFIPKRKLE